MPEKIYSVALMNKRLTEALAQMDLNDRSAVITAIATLKDGINHLNELLAAAEKKLS